MSPPTDATPSMLSIEATETMILSLTWSDRVP